MSELGRPMPISVSGLYDGTRFSRELYSPSKGLTPVYTELFRTECLLPEALQATYERKGEDPELHIVSAGCSVGAEIDSMLAHVKKSGWREHVVMRGWDFNGNALAAARAGRYVVDLYTLGKPEWEAEELERVLDEYGFEYTLVTIGANRLARAHKKPSSYLIDATHVRQGYDLEFVQCDLSEASPDSRPADLITANNMLHHLTTGKAEAVIRNLAGNLNEGGRVKRR